VRADKFSPWRTHRTLQADQFAELQVNLAIAADGTTMIAPTYEQGHVTVSQVLEFFPEPYSLSVQSKASLTRTDTPSVPASRSSASPQKK
jgi:hypothetical protein